MAKNTEVAVQNTTDQLREQAAVVGRDIQELGRIAKTAASETLDQTREYTRQWEQTVEDKIRENPVRSVLIAAGVGAVIGFLLTRR